MSKTGDPRNKTFRQSQKAYKAWLDGHSFVPHTAELLSSAAWRARSRNVYAVRLIDRLEVEHANHNGLENGHLMLTYRQMQEAGISSRFINPTIAFVEEICLVTVTHRGSYRGGARNDPSTFRLTYLPWKLVPAVGPPLYYAPGDEWAKYRDKPARRKTVSMLHTGEATNYHPGEALPDGQKPGFRQNAAPANASPGWKRSSILRSTPAGSDPHRNPLRTEGATKPDGDAVRSTRDPSSQLPKTKKELFS